LKKNEAAEAFDKHLKPMLNIYSCNDCGITLMESVDMDIPVCDLCGKTMTVEHLREK